MTVHPSNPSNPSHEIKKFEEKARAKSQYCDDFFFLENALSPEGRCVAYPVGVQLFLLMFYFGLGNLKKNGHPSSVILAELFPQNVLFDGTGWTCGTGWTDGTVPKSVL